MSEPSSEFIPAPVTAETEIPSKETGNSFPEFIANSPLKNTSYIYSVPVMGEWNNGNLQRMLRGMFSQHPNKREKFEVEIIANIGPLLNSLVMTDKGEWEPKKDKQGKILLEAIPQNEYQKKALELLAESTEAVGYLKQIVEAQRLALTLKAQPQDWDSRKQLNNLIEGITDPLQRNILELAVNKADSISLAVIDATHTVFRVTEYHSVSLSSLRTLGADFARTRFEANPDVVLGMYDVDTVPQDNNAVRDLQKIFSKHLDLNYIFAGMTNLPAGHSQRLIGSAPAENIRRTSAYNRSFAHGSPQISFRLRAYDKLKELSGWSEAGFHGDEDRDTSFRLIYHFGALQDGLLLESSCDLYAPTAMTADRLDGSVDSAGRRSDYSSNGTRYLTADLESVFTFREQVMELIEKQPPEKRQEVIRTLEKARSHFERKQKIQQRFNRLLLNTFLDALDKGLIKQADGQVQVNESDLGALTGGDALLHYIKTNNKLVSEVLSSPDDLSVMRYYSGKSTELPKHPLTSFQLAIREYVGEVHSLDELTTNNIVRGQKLHQESYSTWKIEDSRSDDSKTSIMHSAIAEMLALAHTYRAFFETGQFLVSRGDSSSDSLRSKQWPTNPDEQKLDMHYGDLSDRLRNIKESANVKGTEIAEKGWLSQIQFRSIPIFELFKRLRLPKRTPKQ